jgi:hypothetical protein
MTEAVYCCNSPLLGGGENTAKGAALAGAASDKDPPAVPLDNGLDDGQPQAGAAFPGLIDHFRDAVKSLKKLGWAVAVMP